jgi:hypothetical protein
VGEVTILQVDPQRIHDIWPFLRRGIEDIKRRVESDFIPEDTYWWLRQNAAQAYIVSRGERRLGFFCSYIQARPFSGKKELFLWLAWAIPLAERQPDDRVMDAVRKSVEYMHNQKRAAGCECIVALSSRRGFERYGFFPTITSWVAR